MHSGYSCVSRFVRLTLVGLVLCAALSTRSWAICMDCDPEPDPCSPCNPSSWCYAPCSNPGLWCYSTAGCGAPVCSACNASSSCYDPCTLSCFDEATCGVGPSDPSPILCDEHMDGVAEDGLVDAGFAMLAEESGTASVATGSFTLCVDFPPSGQSRRLFPEDDDEPVETSQGIASVLLYNYRLTSETMAGSSLSDKARQDITNCVQNQVNTAMAGSANRIAVTNTCPTAQSQEPFARAIVGIPSAGLAAKMKAAGDADGAAARKPDCRPKDDGVALVNAAKDGKNRSNREICQVIVHEFFHTLGLMHVVGLNPPFPQDIMQSPLSPSKSYTPTDVDLTTKKEPGRCAEKQNTKKKVQQAIEANVQPICGLRGCERAKGEDCQSCPTDCGGCGGGEEPVCGDGACNGGETCTCPDCRNAPFCSGGSGPGGVCCEFNPGSNCLFVPCGPGWRCISNSCFPGCVTDQDCAFRCTGPNPGLCRCEAGQCQRTFSCVCDCTGPFCCPPGYPGCRNTVGGGGGGGDPVWDLCFFQVCGGEWHCADSCWEFFAQ